MKALFPMLSLLLAALPVQAENASDWKLDTAHSTIGFEARHLGLSRVRGDFREYAATIEADTETGRMKAVKATAQTASIDTGIDKRDEHLRSDDFFNAAKFPQLSFVTRSVTFDGDEVTVVANLTLRDRTRTVTFSGEKLGFRTVDFGRGPQQRAAYYLSTKVSREAFGLKFGKLVDGIAVVSDEVKIVLEVQFYRPVAVTAAGR